MRPAPPEDVPTTASGWAVRLNEGALPMHERHAFAQWLAENQDRLQEIDEAQAVLRIAGALKDSEIARAHLKESLRSFYAGPRSVSASPIFTRRALVAGATSVAAGALFAAVFRPQTIHEVPVLSDDAKVTTRVGAIEYFNLSDRSSLTVGARSSVQVAFSDEQREIALDQGKAFFDVTHNPDRPFIVKAGSHHVLVTGTKFNVSYNRTKDQIEVAVVEGSVNVGATRGAATTNEQLTAGAVTLFPASRSGISRKLTPRQAAAWRTGDLYFDDAELDDLLLDVNGYLPKPMILADADLYHLTLTAELPAGDTHATLFVLREVLGIEARELPDHWELVKADV